MFEIVLRVLVNAVALVVAIKLVPHVSFHGEWWQLLLLAAIFGVVNAYIRPVLKLLSLPLNLLTFGLVGFIINVALVLFAAGVGGALNLGFTLAGWPGGAFSLEVIVAALLTSIVISIVSVVMSFVRLATPGAR